MKKLIAILVVAATITVPLIINASGMATETLDGEYARASEAQVGRYQIAVTSTDGYLRLDTKSGEIKLCQLNGFNSTTNCWSMRMIDR